MAVQEGLVADDEDDDCETALEDARTGLDLLLRSLARDKGPRPPPVAKSAPDNPPHVDLSEADSIDATPLEPTVGSAPHNNTVTPTPKDVARNIRLKQATLSFGKSSATTDGDNNRAGPSNLEKSRWKLNLAQLINDVYEDAYEKWLATWSTHAGDAGKCRRRGKGATDVQTQAFRKHAGTQKHKLAMAKYTALVDGGSRQPRIDQHRAACDEDKLRVVALLDSLLFVSKCDAPMGLWVKLVRYLAEKGVKGFPKKGYGTYYTTTDCCSGKHLILYVTFIRDDSVVTEFMALLTVEKADAASLLSLLLSHVQAVGIDLRRIAGISTDGANVMMGCKSGLVTRLRLRIPHLVTTHCIAHREALAAKDASDDIPDFKIVDKVIRNVADHLGRSGPWHQCFLDLKEVFTSSSLELQGTHAVRWLSRGDAVLRFLAVLPADIVMLKEYDKKMFALVSSYRFHFLLNFIADVLEQLNILNRAFQHKEVKMLYNLLLLRIKRTTFHIESRYVDCGDDFGGGMSERLSPFLTQHGPGGTREMTVAGIDSDGRPTEFSFVLHEDPMEEFGGRGTHDGCVDVCTAFAEMIVSNIHGRLGDLESLSGLRLFTPDAWPLDRGERHARCVEWLESLITLFKAELNDDILPGGATAGRMVSVSTTPLPQSPDVTTTTATGGGVVVVVEVSAAAVEAVAAVAAAGVAEAVEVVEAAEAVVELVAELHRGVAPVVVSASSSSAVLRPPPLSSFVSGTLGVSAVEVLAPAPTFSVPETALFPDATEIPRWGDLSRAGVAVFDLDYDAILAAMYALSTSDEGDCYLCVPPDPGIEAAALGAGETAALGASASAAPGAGESAPSGTASAQVFHTFTLDSGASRSFFRDRTTLTPLSRPVAVSLADPSGGPVLASFSTILPCPAAPSSSLSGLYLPSFSTNLVSGADLQDQGVDQFTPASQRVTHCTCARTGRHLATFTRRPGSSLYTLSTESSSVSASGQVAASSQVLAAASGSGPESAPCSCRLLSHQTLLWHHRLGHPSLPRLRGMASRVLVSGLPRTSGMGLVLGGRSPVVLTGHADASWADDQATQRSSQGYTFSLGSGSVSWRSTRSSSVLSSSCEAEIYAGAMAAQELRWLTYLLTDLGEQPRSPPVLYVDNKAMLALCREHRLEHRTKHIALRYFLARELQQCGQLRLP
ncbi:unnamed protein product [Closterium sp. NIES-53]